MPFTKHKDGDYIELHWEYSDPDAYYVRGHVDEPTFRAAIESHEGRDIFYGVDTLTLRHAFAFWSMEGGPDVDRVLRECPRRAGAFKVTVWDVETREKRDQALLAALGAKVMHRTLILHSDVQHKRTSWPWPFEPPRPHSAPLSDWRDTAHIARYSPDNLNKSDAMHLAGIADAYATLVTHPVASVRDTMHELRLCYVLWCRGVLKDETPIAPAPAPPEDSWLWHGERKR